MQSKGETHRFCPFQDLGAEGLGLLFQDDKLHQPKGIVGFVQESGIGIGLIGFFIGEFIVK